VSDDFVVEAFREARKSGILVILDEVVTGFRVGLSGMQAILTVTPELTCLAKNASGGLPGGVVAGSAEVMSLLAHCDSNGQPNGRKVLHQGTFTGNPVTAAAAVTTIQEIAQADLCKHANRLGELARLSLNDLFQCRGIGWLAYGRYSGFHILPRSATSQGSETPLQFEDYLGRSKTVLQKLKTALNLEGVDIGTRGSGFVSGMHTEADICLLTDAFDRALERLRRDSSVAEL
jgi:glutamate-1-semialdehyde 2,1-aminomutase